ncbi:hypothetical protein FLB_10510 [Flavobacterium succinicans]|uniref:Uncharacterized protein n=1 Tax=Flavobacterium succinicans TaxID=29536 RepID=A0A199XTI2_9FLAO|nr:hypothetical protein FLB_10510 [Flavobacterium succinicans]
MAKIALVCGPTTVVPSGNVKVYLLEPHPPVVLMVTLALVRGLQVNGEIVGALKDKATLGASTFKTFVALHSVLGLVTVNVYVSAAKPM